MAQLPRPASRPPIEPTVEDEPAGDPGPEGEHDRVRGAARGAGAMLGQGRVIAVVVNEHGQSEPFGHDVGEGDVDQRSVDADPHLARVAVDQRRQAEADGVDLSPCRFAGFGDRVDGHVEQGALLHPGYGPLNAVMNA